MKQTCTFQFDLESEASTNSEWMYLRLLSAITEMIEQNLPSNISVTYQQVTICPDRADITTVQQLRQEIAGCAVRLADETRDRSSDLDQIEFLEDFAGEEAMKIEREAYAEEESE